MKRRNFLKGGSLVSTGILLNYSLPSFAKSMSLVDFSAKNDLYTLFKNPELAYRPYVRWWWNGNKVDKAELIRELKIIKAAGIGGVDIYPISFPERPEGTDDLGIDSLQWLSDEWIDALKFTLIEAKKMGITCDLLVGTGFPFGAEFLNGEERCQVAVLAVKKLKGPLVEEISVFTLLQEADPAITNPYLGRKMELLSVKLVPDPITKMEDVIDLSDQIKNGTIHINIPRGKFAVYGLVKIVGFMRVIQGAPGGRGPVLNHFDKKAVKRFLETMSTTIQDKIGPLSPYVRSFSMDSLELEGANWTSDMMNEFKARRGYDIYPYLPFILFKTGRMGNILDPKYPAEMSPEIIEMINRMRYDFELTKAELHHERFAHTFAEWCKENKIKSRVQAYGKGFFPLEGSFEVDIPEGETWLKYGIGEEVSEEQFSAYPWHHGQGNTMINKYVSSAAHLKGKKLVSSEELTNTAMVFNESLEIFKIAGDQSVLSGVTHPIFHGFNYSPPNAPFPGWITYGGYFNEKNTMWPYFKNYTDYVARISALLQQAVMFAEIAVLPPTTDLWSIYGAQMEPFPTVVHPPYQMLIWESIHQNGAACDYVSEQVIQDSGTTHGFMTYGDRKYHTLFLIEVESLSVATAKKLLDFVSHGGRVFCIEKYPTKSGGWLNFKERNREVEEIINELKKQESQFILVKKPTGNFTDWYKQIQEKYTIPSYVSVKEPNHFIKQIRYQAGDTEILFFSNSSSTQSYDYEIAVSRDIFFQKQAWIWNPISGERYKVKTNNGSLVLKFGPADSKLLVFDKNKEGREWKPMPLGSPKEQDVSRDWAVELRHINGTVTEVQFDTLSDLKDRPEHVSFSGTLIYRKRIDIADTGALNYLNIGKVHGISEVIVNGKTAGVKWYGNRIFLLDKQLVKGSNTLEIKVITTMGNYMKTLTDNPVAQYWTNENRKNQPLQSMGLCGPVKIY